MQILASALPGFRELRAPLTAGYLWVLFLWIVIKPDLNNRPTNAVAGSVYDLAKHAGPIWIGLGVGVAAYLIGSVSQALSPLLSRAMSATDSCLLSLTENRGSKGRALSRMIAQYEPDPIEHWEQEAARRMNANGGRDNKQSFDKPTDEIDRHISKARRRIESELELPATVLMTGREPDPQVYSEADRLKAEREWRLAVVPPLSLIAIFLGLSQSCWWWLALIGVGVLLWQGYSRNSAYRSVMIEAMQRQGARSFALEELNLWVQDLPENPLPPEQPPSSQ